jgi:hypothetical protein
MKRASFYAWVFAVACLAGVAFAAPSLLVTKPPVKGSDTGPTQDPHSIRGQWFTNVVGQGLAFRNSEFHDNVTGFGGGLASHDAVYGRAWNLQFAVGPGSPIVSFNIDAVIVNDAPADSAWAPGSNRHEETSDAEEQYRGTLYQAKLAIEFAVADSLILPPANEGPYTNANLFATFIEADNEDEWAWYCWSPLQLQYLPHGNYYVPTWDFGDIEPGRAVTNTLKFVVPGGLVPADPRYALLIDSAQNGTDLLQNRTTSLKISTWVEALSDDNRQPYPNLQGDGPLRNSDCSVFHNVLDFGDAPDPLYPTLYANDGARHVYNPMVYLGSRLDVESDGQPTPHASGDDTTWHADEDGIAFLTPIAAGQSVQVQVQASTAGFLNGWIDFNADGDWNDAGEQVFSDEAIPFGLTTHTFTAPTGFATTNTFARFRYSTQAGLAPTGLAPDGEVEDYEVSITGDGGTPEEPPEIDVKWSQPPDCDHGLDVRSYTAINEPAGNPLVADDWLCDGRPITGIRWWGSYIGFESGNNIPNLEPPFSQRPVAFRLTWYKDIPAVGPEFSRPGEMIATTSFPMSVWGTPQPTGFVNESYYCLSDLGYVAPGTYEHEYEYELVFPPNLAWNEKEGTVYWLSVEAVYEDAMPLVNPWGWKTTHPDHNWNDDAVVFNWDGLPGPIEMVYPPPGWESVGIRHPYFGQSVNMAFELLTDVIGRRAKKWVQPPNVLLGVDIRSWSITNEPMMGFTSADNWLCDGRRITDIHWWGSYLGYMTNTPGEVPSPPAAAKPVGFFLSWHNNAAGMPAEPPITNVFVPFRYCHEVYFGTGTNFGRYEHEFQYYVDLLNVPDLGPWLETSGTVYWLDISAAFGPPWLPGTIHDGWGWLSTTPAGGWGDASRLKTPGTGWGPNAGYDLAFELTTDEVGTGPYWWNQPIAFKAIAWSNLVYSVGDAGSGVQVLQWCTNLASNVWVNLATNNLPLPAPYTNLWRDIPPARSLKFYRVKQTATP